jgi:hypothetical protein
MTDFVRSVLDSIRTDPTIFRQLLRESHHIDDDDAFIDAAELFLFHLSETLIGGLISTTFEDNSLEDAYDVLVDNLYFYYYDKISVLAKKIHIMRLAGEIVRDYSCKDVGNLEIKEKGNPDDEDMPLVDRLRGYRDCEQQIILRLLAVYMPCSFHEYPSKEELLDMYKVITHEILG